MHAVAAAAGVSKGLVHYHFASKEHLLIETWRVTFRKVFEAFEDNYHQGSRGLGAVLASMDALWLSVHDMRQAAPFVVEVLSLVSQNGPIRPHFDDLDREAMALLERGLSRLYAEQPDTLGIPAHRLARLVRIVLAGLVVELAIARTDDDVRRAEQAYHDLRDVFARVAALPPEAEEAP